MRFFIHYRHSLANIGTLSLTALWSVRQRHLQNYNVLLICRADVLLVVFAQVSSLSAVALNKTKEGKETS